MAQAIASLVLIIRRRLLEGATLLLDSSNGLYAIIGILCAWNSLLIHFVGGEWEVSDCEIGKPEPFLQRGKQLLEIKRPSDFGLDYLMFLFPGFALELLYEALMDKSTGNVPKTSDKVNRIAIALFAYILSLVYVIGLCFAVSGIRRSWTRTANSQSDWTTSFGYRRIMWRLLLFVMVLPFLGF
ncbi:hypothetical protein MMC13_001551 [Lambiella insularis]|nr:hypothetical protein [Lambiella insularis]